MTEKNSIKVYLNPNTRIGRLEYLVKLLVLSLLSYISFYCFNYFDPGSNAKIIYVGISLIVVLWFKITFLIQRSHDLNISPYYFGLFPIVGVGGFAVKSDILVEASGFIFLLAIVCLIFIPGTKGRNNYGDRN